ncbi:MAG TPA: hypothetical protein VK175_04860 [Leadbetterella sp.]|nr:hypothetical protein [Leadbetterella sp.]
MKKLVILIIISVLVLQAHAQNTKAVDSPSGVVISNAGGTDIPNSASILDIRSTNKGVLIPRMTTIERDAIVLPIAGLMIYNSSTNRFNFWNGSSWLVLNSEALTLPFVGTGVENSGGQAGLFKIINTGLGNGIYVKSGSGSNLIATQAYAGYFESSENGIFAGGGAGKLGLKTSGGLQFVNNGEAQNSILTSIDGFGTAEWRNTAVLSGLDVNGPTSLGTTGTALNEIIKVTRNGNIGAMNPGAVGSLTFSVTNAQVGSTVTISPTTNLPAGVVFSHALVEMAGVVEIKFFNASGGVVDPPAQNFHITIIR